MANIDFRRSGTYRDLYTGVLQIKGTVATTDSLPTESAQFGDIYFVGTTNPVMYTYNGSSWNPFDVEGKLETVSLDINLVPATGTLTEEQLTKLESDNCLLLINGRIYRKSFESNSGLDYLPLGTTTYMDGIRSTYFTVTKSTRKYTLAYTKYIEANQEVESGRTLAPLENIKVGNTTYAVTSGYVVECEPDARQTHEVVALDGQPSFADMFAAFTRGMSVTLKVNDSVYTGYYKVISSVYVNADQQAISLVGYSGSDYVHWMNPDYTFSPSLP